MYFMKLHKEQERLKIVEINWDDSQNFTQAVYEMYLSRLFGEDGLEGKIGCGKDVDNVQVLF